MGTYTSIPPQKVFQLQQGKELLPSTLNLASTKNVANTTYDQLYFKQNQTYLHPSIYKAGSLACNQLNQQSCTYP